MAALVTIDQSGAPAGVAGRAREDLVTGTAVLLTSSGGPFGAYQWVLDYAAVDVSQDGTVAKSTAALSAPTSSATQLTPVDRRGTYAGRLLVDSGAGLGAGASDVAYWSFAAGVASDPIKGPPAADPTSLPRRMPAAGERGAHNVADATFPSGNPIGWAFEMLKWSAIWERLYARQLFAVGIVALTGSGASLGRKIGLASATRNSVGNVTVSFSTAFPDALYGAVALPIGPVGGSCVVSSRSSGSCVVERGDPGGSLVDADFVLLAFLRFGL